MRRITPPLVTHGHVLAILAYSVKTATLSAERPSHELGHLAHRDVGEVRLQLQVPARFDRGSVKQRDYKKMGKADDFLPII